MDEDDFEKTLIWAAEEEKLRATRGQGVGSFYLVVTAIIIFVIIFLTLYFYNRGSKMNALEMMQDPDNVFDGYSETYEEEEEVPLIEMSEEVEDVESEPELPKLVPPVK